MKEKILSTLVKMRLAFKKEEKKKAAVFITPLEMTKRKVDIVDMYQGSFNDEPLPHKIDYEKLLPIVVKINSELFNIIKDNRRITDNRVKLSEEHIEILKEARNVLDKLGTSLIRAELPHNKKFGL